MCHSEHTTMMCKSNTVECISDMLEQLANRSGYVDFDKSVKEIVNEIEKSSSSGDSSTLVVNNFHYEDDYFVGSVLVHIDRDGSVTGHFVKASDAKALVLDVLNDII